MRKTFVLDTNVLLHDPLALTRFEDNHVVVPIEVVEEIDRFKRDPSEKGRNARQVSRLLDELRQKGNLAEGVTLNHSLGGTLKVVFCRNETLAQLPPELRAGNGDNNILAVALEQQMLGGMAGSEGLAGDEATAPGEAGLIPSIYPGLVLVLSSPSPAAP